MVDVVAGGAHGGHDGGVGDGGAVVAEDTAGQHHTDGHAYGGADGDGQGHGDGDEDGEYAPGAAGGEGGQAGSDEDDSAHRGGSQEALAGADDPSGSAAGGADAADAPGQHEDHQDLHHARAALDEGAQGLLEVPDLGDHAHDDGGDGGQNEGGIQRPQGAAVGQRTKDAIGLDVTGVEQAHEDEHQQHDDGNQHIPDGGLGTFRKLLLLDLTADLGAVTEQLAGEQRTVLGLLHGAVVPAGDGDDEHHEDGADGVVLIGDTGHEVCLRIAGIAGGGVEGGDEADDVSAPGGDGEQSGDGRRGGVHDVGQLLTGDLYLIGKAAADGAYQHGVGGIGEPDEHAAQPSQHLSAPAGLACAAADGIGEGLGTSVLFQQQRQTAAEGGQRQDALVVGILEAGEDVIEEGAVKALPQITAAQHHGTDEHGNEQGQHDLACDDRQDNGQQRGNDGQ